MPCLQVAHLREQGQGIIVVVVNSTFGNKAAADQK